MAAREAGLVSLRINQARAEHSHFFLSLSLPYQAAPVFPRIKGKHTQRVVLAFPVSSLYFKTPLLLLFSSFFPFQKKPYAGPGKQAKTRCDASLFFDFLLLMDENRVAFVCAGVLLIRQVQPPPYPFPF